MSWRSVGAVALALAVGLTAVPSASAGAPEGPRLAFTRWGLRPAGFSLVSSDPAGGAPVPLYSVTGKGQTPIPDPLDVVSWSPDGTELAFSGVTGVKRTKFYSGPRTKIFVVPSEGGVPGPVPGTAGGVAPVFSPDGQAIAFAVTRRRDRPNGHGGGRVVFEGAAIFIASLDGTSKRQVTGWRNGMNEVPSSFSPDGSVLAATLDTTKGNHEALAIHLDSGETTVLASNALEPVYSPDGSRIAYLHGRTRTWQGRHGSTSTATFTDLFTMNADGSEPHQLTKTPRQIELAPSWDPSGQRIAYTRFPNPDTETGIFGFGDAIMEVNADGSCQTKILSEPHAVNFGATWQPGPGREAGPISC